MVKIDYNTKVGRRGRFARFALVADLLKPLEAFVGFNGIPYCVEYEGLPLICYNCGQYGHIKDSCPVVEKAQDEGRFVEKDARPAPPSMEEINEEESSFGPRIQAPSRKMRQARPPTIVKNGKGISGDKETAGNTRFDFLGDVDETRFEEPREKISVMKGKNYGKNEFAMTNVQGIDKMEASFKEGRQKEKLKGVQMAADVLEGIMGVDMDLINGPAESCDAVRLLSSGPRAMNMEDFSKNNSVMVIKNTSLPSTHHMGVGFENRGEVIEVDRQY